MVDNRPIVSKGKYDLNFIDWNNELNRIIETGYDFNCENNEQESPIPGMSIEEFNAMVKSELATDEEFEIMNTEGLSINQLNQIKKMKMGQTSKECSVCQEGFQKDQTICKLPCNHIFHNKCIMVWLKKAGKCPNCRLDIKNWFEQRNIY